MRKIKDSPHYPLLRESLEYYHCRKRFFISLMWTGLITVPTFLLLILFGGGGDDGNMVLCILCSLIFLGYSIHCAHQWRQIFLHMDDYLFFPASLTKPIISYGRYTHSVCYTLTFPNAQGEIITRDTGSMFHNHANPCLQDYNGKTVLVGYNEETDRLIVIKRIDQ